MPDIQVSDLRDNVVDQLDNLVLFQQLPENIRQKLTFETRLFQGLNQGYQEFIRQAPPSLLDGLTEMHPGTSSYYSPVATSNSLSIYDWPTSAFSTRQDDGGIREVFLNDNPYLLQEAVPLTSLRMRASSDFYGAGHESFAVDGVGHRLYAPSDVDVNARIITRPDEFSSGGGALSVDDDFIDDISQLAVQSLIKMGQAMAAEGGQESGQEQQEQ